MILRDFIDKVEGEFEKGKLSLNKEQKVYYKDFINTIKNRAIMYDKLEAYAKLEESSLQINTIYKDLQRVEGYLENLMQALYKDFFKEKGFKYYDNKNDELERVIGKKSGNKEVKIRLTTKGWYVEIWEDNNKPENRKGPLNFKEIKLVKEEYEEILKGL